MRKQRRFRRKLHPADRVAAGHMKSALAACLLVLVTAAAASQTIEIGVRGDLPIEADPRQNITVVLTLSNPNDIALNPTVSLELPTGWSSITPPSAVRISPNGTAIAIVSFFVPQEARPGDNRVTIKAEDPNGGSGEFSFPVRISPSIRVSVELRSAPAYVIAGEEPVVRFLLTNRSNLPISVDVDVRSGLDFPATLLGEEDQGVKLDVMESRELQVSVETRASGSRIQEYRLELMATPQPPEGMATDVQKITSWCEIEIIPRVSRERPGFHTIPTQVTIGHYEQIGNGWKGEVSLKAEGKGSLDEEGKHEIDLLLYSTLTLPDFAVFGPKDRYRLNYSYGALGVDLGDNSTNVSPLLGNALYGRGVGVSGEFERIHLDALYHYRQQDNPISHHAAARAAFLVPDDRFLDGFRYKTSAMLLGEFYDSLILDVYQEFRPAEELNLILDLAGSTRFDDELSWAALARAKADYPAFDASLTALYGSPAFAGSVRDRYSINSHFSARVIEGILDLKTGYSHKQSNLNLDEALNSASRDQDFYLGSAIEIPGPRTNINLQWNYKTHRDMLPEPVFDDRTNLITFQVIQPMEGMTLRWRSRWEIINELLIADISLKHLYNAAVDFYPSDMSSLNFYLDLDALASDYYDSTGRLTIGLAASVDLGRFNFKLDSANSLYFRENAYEGFGLNVSGNAGFRINDRNEVISDLRFVLPPSTSSSNPEFRFNVSYRARTNLPVSRKRDVGTLEGKITDRTSGRPLGEVIVRTADRAVVTAEDGSYRISSLPEGDYTLEVDTSRVSLGLIPDREVPITAAIQAGETVDISFGVVEGATISGNVNLYAVPEQKQGMLQMSGEAETEPYTEDELFLDSGYPNVLVEIQNDSETRRLITDRNGLFSFAGLRPGRWRVRIARAELPRYHEFVDESFNVHITAGDTQEVVFRIFPIRRPVTIIMQGGAVPLTIKTTDPQTGTVTLTSAKSSLTDFDALAKALRRTGLPRNANKPQLLNLLWGMRLDEVNTSLIASGRGYSELIHVSQASGSLLTLGGASERRDLAESETVSYFSEGVAMYDLRATLVCTFLNPSQDRTGLRLMKVELRFTDENIQGETVDLATVYEELLALYWSKWRVPVAGVEKQGIFAIGNYVNTVNDVESVFTKEEDELRIMYSSDWFARIIQAAR